MYKNITWSTWSFIPSQWGHTLTSRSPTFPPSSLLVNPELQLNSTNSCQILNLDLRHEGGDEVVQMWSGFWAQLVQKAQGTQPRVTLQVCSEFTPWFWASSFLPLNLSLLIQKGSSLDQMDLKASLASAVLWVCGTNSKEQSGKRVPWKLSGKNGCL